MTGTRLPAHVTIETLARSFMELVDERYPSAEKVAQTISKMGIGANSINDIKTRIVILSTMRDAVKEVSPTKVYRSIQHRDDLYMAIIEALENLEDELEELEEKEEE